MYIKIYFNDKPLFLCNSIDEAIKPFIHRDDAIFIDELDAHTVKTMIHEMQQAHIRTGVFYHPDLNELKKAVLKKFSVIRAAGGAVRNDFNEILMIFRRGKWDLPKGKLDLGETLEECALREVKEETGLKDVMLNSFLTVTYHTYHEGTKYVLKESHWFTMNVSGEQTLTPQIEEDISEIRWVGSHEINFYLPKAFPLITDIIETAKEKKLIAF